MRKLYGERSNILVKDLFEQPDSKYIAFVEGVLGSKAAIACDGFSLQAAPNGGAGVVMLVRKSPLLADDKAGETVAAFSSDLRWAIMDRKTLMFMTGAEWEEMKLADAKNLEEINVKLYGTKDIAKVLVLPSGEQIVVPPSEEDKERAKKPVSMPYDNSSLYA